MNKIKEKDRENETGGEGTFDAAVRRGREAEEEQGQS